MPQGARILWEALMSKTPITITLRADEWEEIAMSLEFLADTCDQIAFVTSAAHSRKFAKAINKRIQESK
jgi:hypothetical protein